MKIIGSDMTVGMAARHGLVTIDERAWNGVRGPGARTRMVATPTAGHTPAEVAAWCAAYGGGRPEEYLRD